LQIADDEKLGPDSSMVVGPLDLPVVVSSFGFARHCPRKFDDVACLDQRLQSHSFYYLDFSNAWWMS